MKDLDDAEFTTLHRGSKVPVWKFAAVAATMVVSVGIWWTQQQVCVALAQDDDRTASRKMAAVVFHHYGIKHSNPKAYELEGR